MGFITLVFPFFLICEENQVDLLSSSSVKYGLRYRKNILFDISILRLDV